MFDKIDFGKVGELLEYDAKNPLIFSSGLFLFLFAIFSLTYAVMYKKLTLRIVYITAFSLYFYYKSSGFYFLLLVLVSLSDFGIGIWMSRYEGVKRKLLITLSILLDLGLLVYFKYTNMFIDIANNFRSDQLDFEDIFLPIGISFFTFQSLSYVIDIYRKRIEPLRNWLDYLFYISFFPQLVAGPIVRARDFIPQIRQNPAMVSREMFGSGVILILFGLFKKAVISDYISTNFVDRVFDNPLLYSGFENLMAVYGYALQIYCDFSGYSDMAIGLALILGFRFNINFDSPYQSASITEFWRRWHISLSEWLKDYLYISLGGNKKGKIRTYGNLILTMLLGGLWHGASLQFLFWGGIHGVSLATHKLTMHLFPSFKATGRDMTRLRRIFGVLFTFNLVCAGWIFFRADSMEMARQMFSQIFTDFHASIAWDFVVGYKWVVLLMVIGYLLHFAPSSLESRFKDVLSGAPLLLHAAMITALIWIIFQIKSGDIQPFIYFQF